MLAYMNARAISVGCRLAGMLLLAAIVFLCVEQSHAFARPAPGFDEVRLFGRKDSTEAVALGDLNADGALDLVVGTGRSMFLPDDPTGSSLQQNLIYLNTNDGSGSFRAPIPFGFEDDTTSIALGDLNNDGALDLVVGNNNDSNLIYLNKGDGSGTFKEAIPFGDPGGTTSVALGDLDGNGTLDLVVGRGGLRFVDVTSLYHVDSLGTKSVACADVPDAVGEHNLIYLNRSDGSGTFQAPIPFGGTDKTTAVALGDLNRDGALDLVVGNGSVYPFSNRVVLSCHGTDASGNFTGDPKHVHSEQNLVYLNKNDGTGTFRDAFALGAFDATTSLAIGDLNNDDAPDLVVGNGGVRFQSDVNMPGLPPQPLGILLEGENNLVYLNKNDGSGAFRNPVSLGFLDTTTSVAMGDANADGKLDILIGNDGTFLPNRSGIFYNYIKDGSLDWVYAGGQERTTSVAFADLNNDRSLELIVGNHGESAVYLNQGWVGFSTATALLNSRVDDSRTASVAVGDLNNDGSLDIIAGSGGTDSYSASGVLPGQQSVIYLNKNDKTGAFLPGVLFGRNDWTTSVALADFNGDNALDFVLGNTDVGTGAQDLVYLNKNDGSGTFRDPIALAGYDHTRSVITGDLNGDGALDIVTGNDGQGAGERNLVYLNKNDRTGTFHDPIAFGESDRTYSVALGDLNADGALDIVVGNQGDDDLVYINRADGSGLFRDPVRLNSVDETLHVLLADVNGDGGLDAIFGNQGQDVIYLNKNNGSGTFLPPYAVGPIDATIRAVGDINGDGFPDLVGVSYPNLIFLNKGDGTGRTYSIVPYGGSESTNSDSAALGDFNNDGSLDVVLGNTFSWEEDQVYLNTVQPSAGLTNNLSTVSVARPVKTANANFYSSPEIVNGSPLRVNYRLNDRESDLIGQIGAFYSLDGGGNWRPAIAANDTVTTNMTTSPTGVMHEFRWNVDASGFFGKSDNVVLRLVAYPQSYNSAGSGAFRYVNSVFGAYQHSYMSSQTFPFSMRGTQVQVYTQTVSSSNVLAGAFVYRLLKGLGSGANLMPDPQLPLVTDGQGYLQGRGELQEGDKLAAIWPVPTGDVSTCVDGCALGSTKDAVLYHTSARPNAETLEMKEVEIPPGVQVLAVNADNRLLLFNLDVALEWDARKDAQFLEQLRFNLQRTSSLLFDWTNGQAALGNVRIFHDARRYPSGSGNPWNDSHIRVYASNRIRPSASVGGIISPTVELTTVAILNEQPVIITYGAGQVRMGAIWNRYGESSSNLGDDWARALAHELGHYAFFLEDNYLSLNDDGVIEIVPSEGELAASCSGAMNDPYHDSQSEFHPAAGWKGTGCEKTLSAQSTGRSDWETIANLYPLTPPAAIDSNPGPAVLPLAVTQLKEISPAPTIATLAAPIFSLTGPNSAAYMPSLTAQAYLFQREWLTDLGQPTLDQVQAWGARVGDRLCVFDPEGGYSGCEQIRQPDDQLAVEAATWEAKITVTPVSSLTIAIGVVAAVDAGKVIGARLYPVDVPASADPACILLQAAGDDQYAGIFSTLNEPALEGFVHIWLQTDTGKCEEPGDGATAELVTGYTVGGNPVHHWARRAPTRAASVHHWARRAPVISADGQVMVYGEAFDLNQDNEWFFTLQATTAVPHIPPGRTLVGQAYRLSASDEAPGLDNASISFGYFGDQVPAGEESFLRIYFWDVSSAGCQPNPAPCWSPLDTTGNTDYNFASAKTRGPGLYALLSSMEIPLSGLGWNNFAYPRPGSQPVPDALKSVDGKYTIVYGYDAVNPNNPWRVYSPTAPSWANDLLELIFGQGYWIYMGQPSILYPAAVASEQDVAHGLTPPAAICGTIDPRTGDGAVSDDEITAWVGDNLCGRSPIQEQQGHGVYMVKVAADDGGAYAGCGVTGRDVRLQIRGQTVAQVAWDNTLMTSLVFAQYVFLPAIDHNAVQPASAAETDLSARSESTITPSVPADASTNVSEGAAKMQLFLSIISQ